jgi:hypothetical protein
VARKRRKSQTVRNPQRRLQNLERELKLFIEPRVVRAPTWSRGNVLHNRFVLQLQELLTQIDHDVEDPALRAALLRRARAALDALATPTAAKRWLKTQHPAQVPTGDTNRKPSRRERIRAGLEIDRQSRRSDGSVRTVSGGLPGLGKRV